MNIFLLSLVYLISELNMSFSTDYLQFSSQKFTRKINSTNRLFNRGRTKLKTTELNKLTHHLNKKMTNEEEATFLVSTLTASNTASPMTSQTFSIHFDSLKTDNLNSFYFNNNSIVSNSLNDMDYIGYRVNNSLDTNQQQANNENKGEEKGDDLNHENHYWALVLLLFPVFTISGNILIVLSVIKEKSLRTVTNYFVVSLALADLTVAAAVMPFAVYYEVTQRWLLSNIACDAWVATDVMGSTASILNLTAIAVDRYIAVTQPIKYARHKNSKRIFLMIVLVWFISIAVASPIVVGWNNTPDREPEQCAFNNEIFLIYSSLFSFYIPSIVMVFLYYKIFKVIRGRAQTKKLQAAKQKNETCQKKLQQQQQKGPVTQVIVDINKNNKILAKQQKVEREKITLISPGIFRLKNKAAQIVTFPYDQNLKTPLVQSNTQNGLFNSKNSNSESTIQVDDKSNNESLINKTNNNNSNSNLRITIKENDSSKQQQQTNEQTTNSLNKPNGLNARTRKFIRAKTAINVLRTQSSMLAVLSSNKERKVTKTLAIVVIVFLVCWTPFFAINNILKGICKHYRINCSFIKNEHVAFLTWLGYVNSLLNPIIYTIFNVEFRKAFAKIISELFCKK